MDKRDQHIEDSLRRWIQGDIDQREEAQLDRRAREDEFLAEALEGYRKFPAGKHEERLDRMRAQLEQRTKSRRRGGLLLSLPFRIAAAAAVLLAIGFFFWLNPVANESLAEADTATEQAEAPAVLEDQPGEEKGRQDFRSGSDGISAESEPAAAKAAPAGDRPEDSLPAAEDESLIAESRSRREAAISEAAPQAAPNNTDSPPGARAEPGLTDSAELTLEQSMAKFNANPPPPPPPPMPGDADQSGAVARASREMKAGVRLITGKVLDLESGEPLIGAQIISVGDQNIGTITDTDGQYQLLLDSAIQQLEFQHTGYYTQSIPVPDQASYLEVTLDQATALDEIVVTGYGDPRRKRTRPDPSVTSLSTNLEIAEPEIGFRRFERYLRRNLQYPQSALDQRISGEVLLAFTILPTGELAEVEVVRAPSPDLGAEAARLLRNGPKWNTKGQDGQNVSVVYLLQFSL